MKLALISDTHNQHFALHVPAVDLLIHAGDFTGLGSKAEVIDFLDWFAQQPAWHKVLIAGNHDMLCERDPAAFQALLAGRQIHYLNDSGCTILGHKIWGSPITPRFGTWAFYRDRGEQIKQHWDLIPPDTSILVTHGPPLGVGDRNRFGEPVGCGSLLAAVQDVQPRLHVFGHVHEGKGSYELEGLRTRFLNVASLSSDHRELRQPVVIDLV